MKFRSALHETSYPLTFRYPHLRTFFTIRVRAVSIAVLVGIGWLRKIILSLIIVHQINMGILAISHDSFTTNLYTLYVVLLLNGHSSNLIMEGGKNIVQNIKLVIRQCVLSSKHFQVLQSLFQFLATLMHFVNLLHHIIFCGSTRTFANVVTNPQMSASLRSIPFLRLATSTSYPSLFPFSTHLPCPS